MTTDPDRRQEATSWFARLQSRSVTTCELAEFAKWRADPANSHAYRMVETMWDQAGDLGDDPDIVSAVADVRRRKRFARWWNRRIPRWLTLGAGVAMAAIAAALIAAPWSVPTWRTATGERSLVRLDDGTRVQLDTNTTVSARLDPDRRLVRLDRGQAYFEVQHDARRPFVVEVDGISVTALGTRFDVDFSIGRTRVSLLEGSVKVELSRTGRTVRLQPGESVLITGNVLSKPLPASAVDMTSWREGRLTFRETPLSEAVAAMNRYTDRAMVVTQPSLGREPISGDFATDDVDRFVLAVDALFGSGTVSRPAAP